MISRSTLPTLAASALVLLAACGGGSEVPVALDSPADALSRVFKPATRALESLKGYSDGEGTRLEQLRRLVSLDNFNDLLEEVMEVLGVSPEGSAREALRRNRKNVAEVTRRVQELREELMSAPTGEEVGLLESLYTDSRDGLQDELDEVQSQLRELHGELRELGLELSREDVSTLLSTVTGEDFMELVVATNTVRVVTVQLEQLASEPDSSAEAARRYYGVYLIMLYAMECLHVEFTWRIEGELLPRLAEIEDEARQLLARIDERVGAGGDEAIAEQNRASNELTLRAVELYTVYLTQQAEGIHGRIDALRSNIADAELTYETIALSGEIAQLIRNGLQDLSSLLTLQPPPMARLESPELREEFRRLSERIVTP
jgi:two-component sensor histidine kinase